MQGCRSLLSIRGDNLQFYPNFALFSTLRGMNLDHDFVQVSKLSEDQKKGLHRKCNTIFPLIQVDTYAQMHTRGRVEDTRLEAKAKDTKKSEAKVKDCLSEDPLKAKDRNARGQGRRTQPQVFSKKKVFKKVF